MTTIPLGDIGYTIYPDLTNHPIPSPIVQSNLQELYPSTIQELQQYMYRTKLEFLFSLHVMILSVIYLVGTPLLLLYCLVAHDYNLLLVSFIISTAIIGVGMLALQLGRKWAFNRRLRGVQKYLTQKNLDVYGPAGVPLYFVTISTGFPHWRYAAYLQIGRNIGTNATPKSPVGTGGQNFNQPLLLNEYVHEEPPHYPPVAPYPPPNTSEIKQ